MFLIGRCSLLHEILRPRARMHMTTYWRFSSWSVVRLPTARARYVQPSSSISFQLHKFSLSSKCQSRNAIIFDDLPQQEMTPILRQSKRHLTPSALHLQVDFAFSKTTIPAPSSKSASETHSFIPGEKSSALTRAPATAVRRGGTGTSRASSCPRSLHSLH